MRRSFEIELVWSTDLDKKIDAPEEELNPRVLLRVGT